MRIASKRDERSALPAVHRDGRRSHGYIALPYHCRVRAVYTALFGNYENLSEQPASNSSKIQWICFTDNPNLVSDSWEIKVVEPMFPLDTVRSARMIKILGHPALDKYEETLWIDNRITLKVPPELLLEEWLSNFDLAMFEHSYRERLVDEFYAITQAGYDDPGRVYEQLIHYAEVWPQILDAKPIWTALVARRRTPEVDLAMRTWANHVLRYSRRDQLSVILSLWPLGASFGPISGDNWESQWHTWAHPARDNALGRDSALARDAFVHSIRAPLSRLAEIEGATTDKLAALEASNAQLNELVEKLRGQLAKANSQVRAAPTSAVAPAKSAAKGRSRIGRLRGALRRRASRMARRLGLRP